MSTTENSTVAPQPQGANTRRDQVMIGELPSDFLRLDDNSSGVPGNMANGTPQDQQIASDERVAQILQAQQAAGYSAVPSNIAGKLSITVVQAKLAKNYGLTKMDPYCRIRVGHGIFETPTDSNGAKNPRWQKAMQCYLPIGVDSVYMEIYDECAFSSDARIAWTHITIPASVFSGETVDDWFSLSGRQGDDKEGMVNVIMSFVNVRDLPPQPMMSYAQPMVIPVVPPMPQMYYPGITPVVQPIGLQQQQQPPQGIPVQPQPQPAQPQQPTYTQDDIDQAKDMFPTMDEDVIKSVFDVNRGNKEAAINSLLAMST